jgi:hypothetical protein
LEWQLAKAGDGDGWVATATNGSPLQTLAGTGTFAATKAESPAACPKKKFL